MEIIYYWVGFFITWAAMLAVSGLVLYAILYLLYLFVLWLYKDSVLHYYVDYLKMKYTWATGRANLKNIEEEDMENFLLRIGGYLARSRECVIEGKSKHRFPNKMHSLYPKIFKHYPLVEQGYNKYFETKKPFRGLSKV